MRTVVITGGSQGIGKAIAMGFAAQGDNVIICARTEEDLKRTGEEIRSSGSICEEHVVDVMDLVSVERFFSKLAVQHGNVDVLITCAGIYGPLGPLEENGLEEWKKALSINLLGTVYCIHSAIPIMKKQGHGKIITLAGGGVGGNLKPNISSYASSKAAVVALTEVLAKELKPFNIQVNAISPGAVNTRLLDQVLTAGEKVGNEFYEASLKQKEEGGVSPEKAAEMAIYLASDESAFVTGKVLSARWDKTEEFPRMKKELEEDALYNLRRIDDFFFKKIKK